jgi:hypothetical protein
LHGTNGFAGLLHQRKLKREQSTLPVLEYNLPKESVVLVAGLGVHIVQAIHMQKINNDVLRYNKEQQLSDRKICEALCVHIMKALSQSEHKVWHGHPVWFLEGNPVVGYSKRKDSVRLLFWSGQSFKEPLLKKEGSFKAADVRYTAVSQIDATDLHRWLMKAAEIQLDYKNIVKRKGVLKKLSTAKKSTT